MYVLFLTFYYIFKPSYKSLQISHPEIINNNELNIEMATKPQPFLKLIDSVLFVAIDIGFFYYMWAI